MTFLKNKTVWIVGAFIALLVVVYIVAPKENEKTLDNAEKISADLFVSNFNENSINENGYEITGLYKNDLYSQTVCISTSGNEVLKFEVGKSNFEKYESGLHKGDKITVAGWFDNKISWTYNFIDCKIISVEHADAGAQTTISTTYDTTDAAETTTQSVTTTKSTTASTTKSTKAATKATQAITTTKTVTTAAQAILSVTKAPGTVGRGETAKISIHGKPNTQYNIYVYYSSGASEAAGLESKTSDSNGNVSWSWEIGTRTGTGEKSITISGGDETVESSVTVVE